MAASKRSVVPPAARGSLRRTAAWTGLGTMLVGSIVSIAAVAICWLPASGTSASASSTVRAGLLTFLAAVHGGITIDSVPIAFVPLGMTILVGLVAWRAGRELAETAEELDERRVRTLVLAALLQCAVFAAACGLAAVVSPLAGSNVSPVAAALAGLLLFAVTGGTSFVRWSQPLRDEATAVLPQWAGAATRAAAAGVAVYLAAGALLVAVSLVMHAGRVQAISAHVGGGWSGIPILLLGVLAAPNAVIAGSAYAAGPGFALGSGNHVSAFTTAHGLLPAFPVLGSMPTGHGAAWYALVLVAATPVAAGVGVAAAVRRSARLRDRLRDVGAAAVITVVLGAVLAWQGGGAIGSGGLDAVGASPWKFGASIGVEVGVVAALALLTSALLARLRRRPADPLGRGIVRTSIAAFAAGVAGYRHGDTDEPEADDSTKTDRLAG